MNQDLQATIDRLGARERYQTDYDPDRDYVTISYEFRSRENARDFARLAAKFCSYSPIFSDSFKHGEVTAFIKREYL